MTNSINEKVSWWSIAQQKLAIFEGNRIEITKSLFIQIYKSHNLCLIRNAANNHELWLVRTLYTTNVLL